MKILQQTRNSASLLLSAQEIALLQNALNEALENVDTHEFATRLSAPPQDVEELLRAFAQIHFQPRPHSP